MSDDSEEFTFLPPASTNTVVKNFAPAETKDNDDNIVFVTPGKENYENKNKKIEADVGALGGIYAKSKFNNYQKNAQAENELNIPNESRVMSKSGLQGYINGQLPPDNPILLKDLEKIYGSPIRTQKEVQSAIKTIQGSPAIREAKEKLVNGQRRIISYRTTPGTQPVDISQYKTEPTLFQRAKNSLSGIGEEASNLARGLGRAATGAISGAVALPQLVGVGSDYYQNKPIDTTQLASGLGALAPIVSRSGIAGGLGMAAQIPYAIKHRNEISNALTSSDISPTAFMGMPEESEAPISNLQAPR